MDTNTSSRHTGRKIWYGIAIAICGLVILVSAVGVVGDWIAQSTLSKVAFSLLEVVDQTAGGLRPVIQRIDQGAMEVRQISAEVSQVSTQISQNIEDQGLIVLLLPEEKENNLVERINAVQETLSTIGEVLAAGLEMYQTIDRIPFVSLPAPSEEQVENIEAAVSQTQADVAALRQSVQDFRSGAAGQVSRVTQAADQVTAGMDQLSGRLNELDTRMVALQEFATQMQTTIRTLLAVVAFIITLFLAWVIYTQVEVIRLYVQRWKLLGEPEAAKEEIKIVEGG